MHGLYICIYIYMYMYVYIYIIYYISTKFFRPVNHNVQYESRTQTFCPKSDYAKICTPHTVESLDQCYKSRAINSQKTLLQENIC